MGRPTYNTRQRERILSLMAEHWDDYLTVDQVFDLLQRSGAPVGRSTVYRTLERLVAEGRMAKVASIRGDAAQYRAIDQSVSVGSRGQMRCVRCGRAIPLDCGMLDAFAAHVLSDHGFAIDQSRTVIYGLCAACRAASSAGSSSNGGGERPDAR